MSVEAGAQHARRITEEGGLGKGEGWGNWAGVRKQVLYYCERWRDPDSLQGTLAPRGLQGLRLAVRQGVHSIAWRRMMMMRR